ncbi:MAG: hypothetical protein AAFN50_06540 [Pseudomonadota bacterium]
MRPNSLLIIVSAFVLLVSFGNRNDIPGRIDYVPSILDEPAQTATGKPPFDISLQGIDYKVEPEYAYDITGMVVSYRHHDEEYSRMHRLAKDHLNMLDVYVIWGDNTRAELDKIQFWNGIFTCNVKTRSNKAWQSFDMNQLSNNHLLSDDEYIRDSVRKIRVGDQIRVQGYLSSYTSPAGKRGTSTTRTDTGDGACETLYIEDFEIVRAGRNDWRMAMYASLVTLLIGRRK